MRLVVQVVPKARTYVHQTTVTFEPIADPGRIVHVEWRAQNVAITYWVDDGPEVDT